jgi:hypothetical protein
MVFNGRAIYDNGVFDGVAEDVADLISMISPYETPLLDALGQAPRVAENVLHEWLEDELSPNTVTSSATVNTAATAVPVHVAGQSVGTFLQVGMVMKNTRTGEFLQITATAPNTLTISRGFGGTSAATIAATDDLFIISDAALEGADVTVDTSRPRTRKTNYCQIFKKDIIVSGTVQAVNHLGGIGNEFDYQKEKKAREAIRDLEKAVIQGKVSGNSLGSSSAYRTFKGVWDHLTTNATSTGTLNASVLDDVIESAWGNGATDLDIIVVDRNWKRVIDNLNDTRVQVMQSESNYRRRISFYEGTFGSQMVVLNRWMPANSLMVLSTQRVHVVPLKGRSFQFQNVAKTGDSEKGMLLGEYTVEVMNEEGMAKAYS